MPRTLDKIRQASVEEYLNFEETALERHEFVD